MNHKPTVSPEALADLKEIVSNLRDNANRLRNDGGDQNITMPDNRWVSGNGGPVMKDSMPSPPDVPAKRVEQQSIFRKVNGGDTLQEKLAKLPDAPPLEDNKNSLAPTKDQAMQNVVAESKHSSAPKDSNSTVQDRIKEWEHRAKTHDQTLKRK